jgi:hypothetical protein
MHVRVTTEPSFRFPAEDRLLYGNINNNSRDLFYAIPLLPHQLPGTVDPRRWHCKQSQTQEVGHHLLCFLEPAAIIWFVCSQIALFLMAIASRSARISSMAVVTRM